MMDNYKIMMERWANEKEYLGDTKPVNQITPKVSVCTITYQHVDYIDECIQSLLNQKTDFPYEIIIGEDGSTDGTREKCIAYAEKYPDKIRLFLRDRKTSQLYDENGKYITRFNGKWTRLSARGEYIAICEGDDYWTDPLKLQKQVDFMEANPECSLCFHATRTEHVGGEKSSKIGKIEKLNVDKDKIIPSREFIEKMYARSVSVFLKSAIANNLPTWVSKAPIGDIPLQLTCADIGSIGYIAGEPMAVYRRGVEGAWSANEKLGMETEEGEKWAFGRLETHLNVYNSFNEHTSGKYSINIYNKQRKWIYRFFFYYLDYHSRLSTLRKLNEYHSDIPLKLNRFSIMFSLRFILGNSLYKKLINIYPAPF